MAFYHTIPSDDRELQPWELSCRILKIIPYQVMTGNYSTPTARMPAAAIIPYQVMTGNYSNSRLVILTAPDHTIPSDDRELQPMKSSSVMSSYHTIPSDDRELQPGRCVRLRSCHHTIPSDDRELQQILICLSQTNHHTIPSDDRELQQFTHASVEAGIIPYQVMTGNYSILHEDAQRAYIIPYQVMTGNYSTNNGVAQGV